MNSAWCVSVITVMPEMYPGPLAHSLIGDAHARGIWSLNVINLRDFGTGKHQQIDDSPCGGGAGMVIKPNVMDAAIQHAKTTQPRATLIHLSPRGELLKQHHFSEFSQAPLTLICGRYEGIDQRVLDAHEVREISLGDFVITGGDLAAMVILDGCVRLLPGVIGEAHSLAEESFGLHERYQFLLEYPIYTKPVTWNDANVPEVLLSGHHANINAWHLAQAERITKARRPDLWARYCAAFGKAL